MATSSTGNDEPPRPATTKPARATTKPTPIAGTVSPRSARRPTRCAASAPKMPARPTSPIWVVENPNGAAASSRVSPVQNNVNVAIAAAPIRPIQRAVALCP